jgi:hypothetical protein
LSNLPFFNTFHEALVAYVRADGDHSEGLEISKGVEVLPRRLPIDLNAAVWQLRDFSVVEG